MKGSFGSPPTDKDLILIGPGTGVAPMRAMLHERMLDTDSKSDKAPVTVLFFGCRSRNQDDLFEPEWQSADLSSPFKNGVSIIKAYSRDQTHKIYVTHKLKEHSAEVWEVLQRGGIIYISGSAKRMPQDVKNTLMEIVIENTGLSRQDASKWMASLEKQGRYVTEVWS